MLINYPISYTSEISRTYAFRQAVPIRYACPVNPPPFLLNETDAWNCNLCGSDIPFYVPYIAGDLIPFQTQFADNYNMPNSVLVSGFQTNFSTSAYIKVYLYDCCGNEISEYIDEFSESFHVGFSEGTGSIQNWIINTGLFPTALDCFRLKIEYYKLNQITILPELERTIWTEYYKEIADCGSFSDAELLESTYSDFDCNGNYYGTLTNFLGSNNLPFYNSLRVPGTVEFFGDTESTTENDRNVVISKDIIENYAIISGVVAPFYIKMLQQAVRGKTVTVNGTQYQNFRYDAKPEDSKMFLLDLSFDKKCRIDNRTCR
jgi:hypothetical protein